MKTTDIHVAAKALREAIEKATGRDAIVMWAASNDEDTMSGISLNENLTVSELEHSVFSLLGRAYKMQDYELNKCDECGNSDYTVAEEGKRSLCKYCRENKS